MPKITTARRCQLIWNKQNKEVEARHVAKTMQTTGQSNIHVIGGHATLPFGREDDELNALVNKVVISCC